MICRNCKFILQGSEKFCPDCGQECKENITVEKEEKIPPPTIFYASEGDSEENTIFCESKDKRVSKRSGSKTSGPAFLIFLLIVCVLTVGGFTAVEYFDLAPVIKDYISPDAASVDEVSAEAPAATQEGEYSDSYGIVSPDISFTPTICYVSSDKAIALRKGPDNSYAMLMLVDSGTQLQIIGASHTDDEWVYVHVPSEECYGWLSGSYLTEALPIQNGGQLPEQATSGEDTTAAEETQPTSQEQTTKQTA